MPDAGALSHASGQTLLSSPLHPPVEKLAADVRQLRRRRGKSPPRGGRLGGRFRVPTGDRSDHPAEGTGFVGTADLRPSGPGAKHPGSGLGLARATAAWAKPTRNAA